MAVWGSNDATSSFSVTTTDAINCASCFSGGRDISNPFTAWSGAGTGFLYLDVVNTSSQDVTFINTPSITITSTNTPAYPGSNCNLIFYAFDENSNTASWATISPTPVSPSGTTLSFPAYTIDPGGSFELAPSVHQYPAFQCQ
jgi:hypothetical protein